MNEKGGRRKPPSYNTDLAIYSANGYVNIPAIVDYCRSHGVAFLFIVGGRGTGKTYGMLKYLTQTETRFLFMRRTQTQLDLIATPELNPFKKLNSDLHMMVQPFPVRKGIYGFDRFTTSEDGKLKPEGANLGIAAALSTITNLRGFDASDVGVMVLDEFIPEPHERPIKEEGRALLNAYETVNRNRELSGEKPVLLACLANANYEANPIFLELGLVEVYEKMKADKRRVYFNRQRALLLVNLDDSPISAAKKETALHKLTSGTDFAAMAYDNEFTADEKGRIKSRNLLEYRALVTVGEITIYKHKSKPCYYVSMHKTGSCPTYGPGSIECSRFRRAYPAVWIAYMGNVVEFETYTTEIYFRRVYNL